MSGSAVKNHFLTKEGIHLYAQRITSYLLLFQGYQQVLGATRRQHRHRRICLQQLQPKSEVTDQPHESGARITLKNPEQKKKMVVEIRTTFCEIFLNGWRSSQIIWRTQNSQDSDPERPTKVVSKSRKHSIILISQKTENCEVCLRTKMTRAPCRRRTGEAPPRAEKFGDLITADHKVLSDNCECRNNHRYAVVVQDLATEWIRR